MKNPLVVKLGGILLSSDHAMDGLFTFLSSYMQLNSRDLLIVHGGGRIIDQMMIKLGCKINKINGLRQTSSDDINLITGILSGTVNKILLSWAKRKNINAIGLCLSDGNSVFVKQLNKELGHVGLPIPGCSIFLKQILKNNFFPIISSIGITKSGDLMNVNADLAAAALAKILDADLILLSDVSSILDGKGKRIKSLNNIEAKNLIKQGIITNGMIIKVETALNASSVLGKSIEIASWQNSSKLELLFNGISIGTRVLYY